MKFSQPVRASEGQGGLTSYAKVRKLKPGQLILNIVEALLGLVGVVLLILVIRYGSFEKAGAAIDQGIGCVKTCIEKLIPHK